MPYPNVVLLDTNVWIDNYVGGREGSKLSRTLISACQKQGVTLCVALLSLKDIYYQIGSELKREQRATKEGLTETQALAIEETAWQCVLNLNKQAVLVPADQSDFTIARYFHQVHPDLEDDFVLAAVKRTEADYFVTNDKKLLSHSPVAALSPIDLLMLLESTA